MTQEDKTLFITGNGRIDDYNSSNAPWEDLKGAIQLVINDNGVESIEVCTLLGFERLDRVQIPSTEVNVMYNPFTDCPDWNK